MAFFVSANKWLDHKDLPTYDSKNAQRIVEQIRLIQNIIDNRKNELCKLDDLIKARFVEMFGDVNSFQMIGWNLWLQPENPFAGRLGGDATTSGGISQGVNGIV